MPTTVQKRNRCNIEVRHAAVGGMSIVRRKEQCPGVRRRSFVPQVSAGDYLFIGRSQRDKQLATWRVRPRRHSRVGRDVF